MFKKIIFSFMTLLFSSASVMAGDMPAAYNTCKKCHGLPGQDSKKRKKFPDLAKSKMTFEQFSMQVKKGSKWEGRPPKMKGYEKGRMPALKKKTDKQIKEIFEYISKAKK